MWLKSTSMAALEQAAADGGAPDAGEAGRFAFMVPESPAILMEIGSGIGLALTGIRASEWG